MKVDPVPRPGGRTVQPLEQQQLVRLDQGWRLRGFKTARRAAEPQYLDEAILVGRARPCRRGGAEEGHSERRLGNAIVARSGCPGRRLNASRFQGYLQPGNLRPHLPPGSPQPVVAPGCERRDIMIETRDLTKMYGELYALNRLTLKLEKGDVYGFIGPNGAGKTTTMRILATLLQPTWGEATVCGYSIYNNAKEIRRAIGYMPDFFGVYDDMKVIEYLEFFAAAYRIKGPERRVKCEKVLELVDLGYKRDALVTSLSRGMTQRLGLARVLLHEPQVLLLDEPASGLDPARASRCAVCSRNCAAWARPSWCRRTSCRSWPTSATRSASSSAAKLIFDGDVKTAIRQVQQHTVLQVAVERPATSRDRDLLEAHADVLQWSRTQDPGPAGDAQGGCGRWAVLAESVVGGFRLKMLGRRTSTWKMSSWASPRGLPTDSRLRRFPQRPGQFACLREDLPLFKDQVEQAAVIACLQVADPGSEDSQKGMRSCRLPRFSCHASRHAAKASALSMFSDNAARLRRVPVPR